MLEDITYIYLFLLFFLDKYRAQVKKKKKQTSASEKNPSNVTFHCWLQNMFGNLHTHTHTHLWNKNIFFSFYVTSRIQIGSWSLSKCKHLSLDIRPTCIKCLMEICPVVFKWKWILIQVCILHIYFTNVTFKTFVNRFWMRFGVMALPSVWHKAER